MTIATTHNRKEYTGNGTNDTFAYDFLILDSAHMYVYVDGAVQTEGSGADYTVTGVANPAGGNVVFNAGSIPAADTAVTLLRTVPYTQVVDYVENTKFPAETHEGALDKLTMIVQQFNERLLRAAFLAVESTYSGLTLPDPVAEKYLAWKADLSGLKNVSEVTPGALTVSAFVETLLDDADASAFFTTLGVSTYIKGLLDDTDAATARGTLAAAASAQAGCRVGRSLAQSIATGSQIKVEFNDKSGGENFDINGEFDEVTNHRFVPQTAGYYLVILSLGLSNLDDGEFVEAAIRKNGSDTATTRVYSPGADLATAPQVFDIVYLNGSTDYIDAGIEHDNAGALNLSAANNTSMSIMLLK
jgi:hypothetical protein